MKKEIKRLAEVVRMKAPLRDKEKVYKEISDKLSKSVKRSRLFGKDKK